jgi:dCMP deaminase
MAFPSKDKYFMDIAVAVSKRANCVGRKVAAVITLGECIISTGYNGTPSNVPNCLDGGCYRCRAIQ